MRYLKLFLRGSTGRLIQPIISVIFLILLAFPGLIIADDITNRIVGRGIEKAIPYIGFGVIFFVIWFIWEIIKWIVKELGSAFNHTKEDASKQPNIQYAHNSISTQCPNCHSFYSIKPEHIGKSTNCNKCGKLFIINEVQQYITLD